MNGKESLVLDTNILIYLSKGEIDFKQITLDYDKLYISVISYMEVMGFNFGNNVEKEIVEKYLTSFEIVQTDMEIANLTIKYRSENKIKIPDAIILATANKMNAHLITRNITDFRNIDKSVILKSPF